MNAKSSPMEPHEKIAALARQLWEQDGRQAGRDLEYWLKAEQQVQASTKPTANTTVKSAQNNQAWSGRPKEAARR